MAHRKIVYKDYSADFETTVYPEQTSTEVWAAAIVALDAPDDPDFVYVYNSIDKFMEYLDKKLYNEHMRVFFHNEKFDGSFIMNFLLRHSEKYQLWGVDTIEGIELLEGKPWELPEGHYTYSVSEEGLWYHITIKIHGHLLKIVDSLKLLPFSVRTIGKSFGTKHKKLEMEYEGKRHAGGEITKEEETYIKNDVLVVKEALNFMHSQGHDRLTIGGCCLAEFKSEFSDEMWDYYFPNLYDISNYPFSEIPEGYENFGEYIRSSYHGGWCYVVPEKANKYYYTGTTADVNSLYPSMMHSESGNRYPIGLPHYFKGSIPEEALQDDKYYFVRVKTRFKIKTGYLPTIQIKNNPLYPPREWLVTSDYIDKNGKAWGTIQRNGEDMEVIPELVLTMTDWEVLQDHYELEDTEIIDGCWFNTKVGIFDNYINKYAEIKMKSKGAMRTLAKLFLNNLYGKFATNTRNNYKVFYLNEEGALRSYPMEGSGKEPGYIPIGSAITSYARRFTINAAQANYHGVDQPGFIYADTDSIHCDLTPDEIVGAPEDPVKFNHWKYEAQWDFGKFLRAKTYVEHVVGEDRKSVEPYYNLKCAGMPDHPKNLFIKSVTKDYTHLADLDIDEHFFVLQEHTWDDFKPGKFIKDEHGKLQFTGLVVPGVLKAQNIPGGVLLCKGNYYMREKLI